VGGILTDIHGAIALPEARLEWRQMLSGCGLDSWRFDHLPVDQSWLHSCRLETDPAPIIDLSKGYSAYLSDQHNMHRDWYKQLKRKERKLERDWGPVRFEQHTVAEGPLRMLLRWKSQQLSHAGLYNPYDDTATQSVLRSVARCAETCFSGILSALHAGDRLLAVMLSQKSGNVLNAWIPAYDSDYANYSPGALLHVHLVRAVAKAGVIRIELGRGMNPLKRTLGSSEVLLAIGHADTRRVRGALSRLSYGLKSRLKQSSMVVNSHRLYRRLRTRVQPQS
jgi:CelD/BcsL family acetyltransferase involved in cellulose biosynthesis